MSTTEPHDEHTAYTIAPLEARTASHPRTVLLAAPHSFCAGVERAIEIVERAPDQRGSPVYVRKQIVHNMHVVAELETARETVSFTLPPQVRTA